jgi:hypothetical protein
MEREATVGDAWDRGLRSANRGGVAGSDQKLRENGRGRAGSNKEQDRSPSHGALVTKPLSSPAVQACLRGSVSIRSASGGMPV